MSIFDDIRRDREAGAPSPWYVSGVRSRTTAYGHSVVNDDFGGIAMVPYSDRTDAEHRGSMADGRRIARVPELERIALAAEELAKVFPDIVGYLEGLIEDGCPKCGGDCSGANPPVSYCPMKSMNNDLARANAALAKLREASK